jgi:hypothetical protein
LIHKAPLVFTYQHSLSQAPTCDNYEHLFEPPHFAFQVEYKLTSKQDDAIKPLVIKRETLMNEYKFLDADSINTKKRNEIRQQLKSLDEQIKNQLTDKQKQQMEEACCKERQRTKISGSPEIEN